MFENVDVERVLRAIRRADGYPLIVGGYVRDMILGKTVKDVDVEVYGLEPDELLKVLNRVGHVKEAGKAFGVFKVRSGETDIDVSLPRRENKIGAGHRGFEVLPDSMMGMREASARRDFTLNAIMLDPEQGKIIDLHHGVDDLHMGILRHTSDAFSEDPLRVIRAIQFVARFGFTIATETVGVCLDLKPTFPELSKERLWTEWEKIGTRGTHFVRMLDALDDIDWTGCMPELVLVNGYGADRTAERCDNLDIKGEDRLVIVFAALLDGLSGNLARSFLERIGCPEHIIRRITPLVENIAEMMETPTSMVVRQLARKLWPSSIADLYVIYPYDPWIAKAIALGVASAPEKPFLTGDHLIAAGRRPGPEFKVILQEALDAQDAGEIRSVEEAIRWMEAHA